MENDSERVSDMAVEIFNRVEKKYRLSDEIYHCFLERLSPYMVEDKFCKNDKFYLISNLYFDTWDDVLIRRSIEHPVYKEKLRLRSYGVPDLKDKVFLEIKKKYKGIVNKRRTVLRLEEAYEFLFDGKVPKEREYTNYQVIKELEYSLKLYEPVPKLYLAYDRKALHGKDDKELRITFDKNIRCRREALRLEAGDAGERIIDEDTWIMEIKTLGSMPVWLADLLTEFDIYNQSFSKYGTEYLQYLEQEKKEK